ncbi:MULTISPECIES: hypothetical protein [Neisseria]|uniref:Uncharacterized protein n=2 Tax=Neisseria lactamica TaxID=486 RepID=D0WCR1_NEILA|nr:MULTISPECIES: hypothetical protein [Neisseria]EEZ74629.1 hypothetical protein NEILACOT_05345 [Neisseria lactamica ATCC 23970]KFJ35275.1 putative methyl-accepting chemotaxis protein [Neisseria lactamica ATCC 23970]SUA17043.1 Uncharacterised protein [Neisseria lactamica]VTQ47993.1 Uncharacterised protein [Neisseria lactamica]
MNYEALGRYTEACEKLQPLLREMKQHAGTVRAAAEQLPFVLDELAGGQPVPKLDPVAEMEKIDTAHRRLQELWQEACRWARTANTNAEQCGKAKLNFGREQA